MGYAANGGKVTIGVGTFLGTFQHPAGVSGKFWAGMDGSIWLSMNGPDGEADLDRGQFAFLINDLITGACVEYAARRAEVENG